MIGKKNQSSLYRSFLPKVLIPELSKMIQNRLIALRSISVQPNARQKVFNRFTELPTLGRVKFNFSSNARRGVEQLSDRVLGYCSSLCLKPMREDP